MKITQTEGIKIEGHLGKWYQIGDGYIFGTKLLLLESERWGDEASWLVVNSENGKVLSDEVYDFDTFYEVIQDVEDGNIIL